MIHFYVPRVMNRISSFCTRCIVVWVEISLCSGDGLPKVVVVFAKLQTSFGCRRWFAGCRLQTDFVLLRGDTAMHFVRSTIKRGAAVLLMTVLQVIVLMWWVMMFLKIQCQNFVVFAAMVKKILIIIRFFNDSL